MDDDVIELPSGWLGEMVRAFETVPRAGYLAANVVQDEITNGAKPPADQYTERLHGDVAIEYGPTGGWCTITSRAVIEKIGSFIEQPGKVFFFEDSEFGGRCTKAFLRVGLIRDVLVYHATGPAANAKFGYLDACEAKYAEDPDCHPLLEDIRKLRETEEQN
jgi:GT2 family glycosyltransferase